MIRSLTDLHGEFTHSQHATVRTMIDSVGADSQITRGLDNKACASYKRAQHYCEDARDTAVMWLDRVPGELNAAGRLTDQARQMREGLSLRNRRIEWRAAGALRERCGPQDTFNALGHTCGQRW